MLFAVLTTIWVCLMIYWIYEGDGEAFAITLFFGGLAWAFFCMIVFPLGFVNWEEVSRTPVNADSIKIYNMYGDDKDIIFYVDENGDKRAVFEDSFTENSDESYIKKECAVPIGWVSPFVWDQCREELVGSLN